MSGWTRILIVAGGALALTACSSYPTEPRYSIRADQPSRGAPVAPPVGGPVYPGQPGQPYPGVVTPTEAPLPLRAPIEPIEGGPMDGAPVQSGPVQSSPFQSAPVESAPRPSASITSGLNGRPQTPQTAAPQNPASSQPAYTPSEPYEAPRQTPTVRPAPVGGSAYVIQQGDTISGVARRFRIPVQSLIDLNGLGPNAGISAGQRLILPDTAVDNGADPHATGPAPIGVTVPNGGVTAPPPPPLVVPALPVAPRPAVIPTPSRPAASAPLPAGPVTPIAGAIPLQWPLRGDIVKPFGPVALGERNNGINIGASAGSVVSAAAAGRVAYVGDDVAGQGLMVVVVHRDGWRTVYAQLGSATVDNNDDIRAGQQIGTVGVSGGDGRPSIHFETRRMQGDNPVAVDPLTVLPR